MAKVTTEYRNAPGAEVELEVPAGTIRNRALVIRGDPANPLTTDEEATKCTSCVDPVTAQGRGRMLVDAVAGLRRLPRVAELAAILQVRPASLAAPGAPAPRPFQSSR
jgi:hypothetical protein